MNIEHFKAKYTQLAVDINALNRNSSRNYEIKPHYNTSYLKNLNITTSYEFDSLDEISLSLEEPQAFSLDN